MDSSLHDKYQKLAREYAKLRTQASVLRKAVLDEQSRNTIIREQLRQRELALRRTEQEFDSLSFRNKQLEYRVSKLQDELAIGECRKNDIHRSNRKRNNRSNHLPIGATNQQMRNGDDSCEDISSETVIFEELQKKIIENAQLISLIDEKDKEMVLHTDRIKYIESLMEKRFNESSDLEKVLRKEINELQCRNSVLENKLVEAASMLSSEDAISASGSDSIPSHNHQSQNTSVDEHLASLEKEIVHWRSLYELSTIYQNFPNNHEVSKEYNNSSLIGLADKCSCSTTAAGITVKSVNLTASENSESEIENTIVTPQDQLFNHYCQKFEALLKDSLCAKSKVTSIETEMTNLQNCLANAIHELKIKDDHIQSINKTLHLIEEDLATTRTNYEEQTSVLTEQVISLSEQLATCK